MRRVLAALALLLFARADAAVVPVCPGDRYVVAREGGALPLVGDGTGLEIVVVRPASPAEVEISSGCPPVPGTLKATKRGAVVKASWPPGNCPGQGKIRLNAKLSASCALTGVLKKQKTKPIKFTATLSHCGDGAVDPAREECESAADCAGRPCQATCRCTRASTTSTTTIALPGTTVTTLPTGVSTSTSTTAITSSTSTTAPSSTACADAEAPVCGGECGVGFGCTHGACVDLSQPCFANEDCAISCAFVTEESGFCAEAQSCTDGSECDSAACVLYLSCFCWY